MLILDSQLGLGRHPRRLSRASGRLPAGAAPGARRPHFPVVDAPAPVPARPGRTAARTCSPPPAMIPRLLAEIPAHERAATARTFDRELSPLAPDPGHRRQPGPVARVRLPASTRPIRRRPFPTKGWRPAVRRPWADISTPCPITSTFSRMTWTQHARCAEFARRPAACAFSARPRGRRSAARAAGEHPLGPPARGRNCRLDRGLLRPRAQAAVVSDAALLRRMTAAQGTGGRRGSWRRVREFLHRRKRADGSNG